MELDWETRPLSIVPKSREWHAAQTTIGPPPVVANSTTFLNRRRSTAVHAPPPGPPPSQPIPSVPPISVSVRGSFDSLPETPDPLFDNTPYQNGSPPRPHPYSRPSPSANLTAVAAFSQARYAATSPSYPTASASSSTDNLSDSPPRSMLRSAPSRPAPSQDPPDRNLLSPSAIRESRPSSRRALTKALELAREAVTLDSNNDDPYAAVMAYGKSVALLSEVMERVMRGEDSTEGRRKNGRRRSVVAQEEEVKRLKAIHDTYADRMNTLSAAFNIPLPPHSPPSLHTSSSVSSATSTQPSSPVSVSPTSETSEQFLHDHENGLRSEDDDARMTDDEDAEAVNTAVPTVTTFIQSARTQTTTSSSAASSPVHPYAVPAAVAHSNGTTSRMSVVTPTRIGRPRASSTLPPLAPPPTSLPPPAPATTVSHGHSSDPPSSAALLKIPDGGRSRGSSVSHKRSGSSTSRLAALQEEAERQDGTSSSSSGLPVPMEGSNHFLSRSSSKDLPSPDPHPLPPIPSPSSAMTPRTTAISAPSDPGSPQSPSHFATPRPRGESTTSLRSETTPTGKLPLINTSTKDGTISIRRMNTSSSVGPSSPTESTISAASLPTLGRLKASALPASTVTSLGMSNRNRASSQPGRRPSVAAASAYPFPPLTAGSGVVNGAPVPRKASVPSRLNPNAPQITVNTSLLSPPLSFAAAPPLVPPPPIPYTSIPTAPLSPLPSLAPLDPLLKPYHMMFLLRQTMTSKTGGYITRRLHVPQEVWSQGGAKLLNIPEKIRVVEVLCSALEEVQAWSGEYFGAGNVSSGMALGIGSIGRKEGEAWASKLEEFSTVCDGVVGNFGKKLGVGEGFVTNKSRGINSWGGRLTRQFDKFTNGKNLDSPALYVQGLSKLFMQAQILDEHTKAVSSQPPAPLYAGFPVELRTGLELKLRHASEFFAKVVLTFVIRDLALLLDKYVKKCEKWLAE